jgi:hypothetical protein
VLLTNVRRITQIEMLWRWARSEGPNWEQGVPQLKSIVPKFLANAPNEDFTDQEMALALASTMVMRHSHLVWFWRQPLEVSWYEAEFPVSAVSDIQVDRRWTRLRTKNRTLRELVDNRHQEARPKNIVGPFKLKEARGNPILICDCLDGPFVIMDGSNRLRRILIEHDAGNIAGSETFLVVIGLHPKAREWPHWKQRVPPEQMFPGEAD